VSLLREICKPVLELDFTAHGVMGSLSEFGLNDLTLFGIGIGPIGSC
jgi:hypothetical protein